ncbi:aspartyl protease family protein 1 [Nymphaea colorata]|nr:aspartyl protease family protein 1 [Nymphaea colorata]
MAPSDSVPLAVFLLISIHLILSEQAHGRTFSLEVHHRYSDHVRRWLSYTAGVSVEDWPEQGSVDYYAALSHHDRVFRGRNLAGDGALVSFIDGNMTLHLNSLGFLHYTTVEIGTPGVRFLVALDTGSDLFWVPCECTSCASSKPAVSGFPGIELTIYSPRESTTSKYVPCNASLCNSQRECSGMANQCPYTVSYVSGGTSSSGFLMEDILYLTTEDSQPKEIHASVVFGCGQVQTGSFLDGAAPNGLFGLGMSKLSVPSVLASSGLIADSFSMCFGRDNVGRINFGDKGSNDQEVTPLYVDTSHPTYNVTITEIEVGAEHIKLETGLSAMFDTGTSFTYLTDPTYTLVAENFNSQTRDAPDKPDSKIPFEYCYDMSLDKNFTLIPITITMKGGGKFPVAAPTISMSTSVQLMYCLAIVKSKDLNIIGQNFMTGHRIVFDRDKLVLGWKTFDCYDTEGSATLSVGSSLPPASTAVPITFNPEDTIINGTAQFSSAPAFSHAISSSFLLGFIVIVFILALKF